MPDHQPWSPHRAGSHRPCDGATHFITWRLQHAQTALDVGERELVVATLRHFDQARYVLQAFVVMHDHVHVMLQPFSRFPLERIVHGWKAHSAHVLQKRGRSGRVWTRGYFHRPIRDESEYEEKLAYIRTNPQRRWPGVGEYPWVWYRRSAA